MQAANSYKVTFLPDGKSAEAPDGTSVVDASIKAGVHLIAPCNGKGSCGKCGVLFQEGVPPPGSDDAKFFTAPELEEGWRLACMHRICQRSVVFAAPATLGKVEFGPTMEGIQLDPGLRKVYLRIASIRGETLTWTDVRASAQGALEEHPTLDVLKKLTALTFLPGMEMTVVVRGGRVVRLEEGDTRLENYGLALDIGTTTVAGSLLDLNTGEELAWSSALNRQSVHGSDVMSRLTSLNEDRELLPVLQRLVLETVEEIVEKMLAQAGARRDRIYAVTVVANSCMHHIFMGLDSLSLAFAPYDALVLAPLRATAAEIGLDLAPDTPVYTVPNIASFIGGDALGAALAVGLHRSAKIKCLVDIGTNGEILLGSSQRIIACSTPAGPAFEGASISCGMIASEGAICKVRIDDNVTFETIGNAKPKGLTGSGLIDLCSELFRVGLLNQQAKYSSRAAIHSVSPRVAEHLLDGEGGKSFLIARAYGKNIVLTQRDVRELQLAKGVIYAGIESLRIELGITLDDLDEIYLAGTFGSYLSIPSARTIGLVPRLPVERIRAVGNAALVGAKMCLLSMAARAEAEALARRIEHVELPLRKDFQDIFMEAMLFPALEAEENQDG